MGDNSFMIELQVGMILEGRVVSITKFGAFVELVPGKDGMIHISKLDTKRVEKVEVYLADGHAVLEGLDETAAGRDA